MCHSFKSCIAKGVFLRTWLNAFFPMQSVVRYNRENRLESTSPVSASIK